MNKIPVRMSRLAMAALFVLLGGIAQAAQTKYLDELAYISATGNLGNRAGVVIEKDRDPRAASDSSNVFYTGYRLEPIADDGYFPSINNLGEMVYEKYDSTGNINVFSTLRGWITFSTSGAARGPDINDSGEVVFCDSPTQTPEEDLGQYGLRSEEVLGWDARQASTTKERLSGRIRRVCRDYCNQ